MLLYKKNKFFIFFLLLLNFAVAQKYPSKNYTTLDGLPSNSIYSIFKDSREILWIGTNNGLTKIVNNNFQTFYEKDGLAFNNCWDIKEDKNKNLWFASYGGGLTFYNGKTFKIINKNAGLVHNNIRKLYLFENYLFVGTHDGISIIDINTFEITNLKKADTKFGNFQVMDFFSYQNEVYFVTYRDGNWKIDIRNKKLQFINFFHDCLISAYEKNDLLYIGIDGLGFSNKGINTFTKKDFVNGKKPTNSFGKNVFWQYANIYNKTFVTANGVNFETGGLFEIQNEKINDISTLYGINSKQTWSVYFDTKNQKLYTGTIDKGLFETDLKHQIKFYNLVSNKENTIKDIEHLNSTDYFLTDYGLEVRRENKTLIKYKLTDFFKFANSEIKIRQKRYNHPKGFQYNIEDTSNKLLKIKIIDDKLWIISTFGFFVLDENNKLIEYYYYFTSNIEKDFDNEIIFQQPHIEIFKTKNYKDNFDLIKFPLTDKNNPKDIIEILKTEAKIFFFSSSSGLYKYQNGLFTSFLNQSIWKEKNLTFAKKINNNQFAISNAQGDVFIIDISNKFRLVKKISRDLLYGKTISFLESFEDNLIIATEKGINIFDGKRILLLDKEIGFQNNFFSSGFINRDTLTVGTFNGYYKLNLKQYLLKEKPQLELKVVKLEVNYKKYNEGNYKWFQFAKTKLELPYDKNTLLISYEAKGHPYTNKLLYRYKVIGLPNANWSEYNTNKAITLPYLPNGNFEVVVEVKDLYSGVVSSHKVLNICIVPPFWKTWWFIMITLLFLFAFGFFVYKKRIAFIQNQERSKSEIQKRLAETKMEALQSQMNPHFIFNAMNSIQNYIIDNNTDDALMYMGEFSKLIRQTLNNSSKTKICLLEEIQYLQSYVLLENMRFKKKINFELSIEDDIDMFETEIPPMLIQPFLENAFIHAFDSFSVNPKLSLSFTIQNNNLIIMIKDNGKGLAVENLNKLTESKGIKLAQERISLFQPNENDSISITSEIDKGTIITLRISKQV